jgi:hypothetical protein
VRRQQEEVLDAIAQKKVLRVGKRGEASFLPKGRRTASLPLLLSLYGKGVSEGMKVDRGTVEWLGEILGRGRWRRRSPPPPPSSMPAREVA